MSDNITECRVVNAYYDTLFVYRFLGTPATSDVIREGGKTYIVDNRAWLDGKMVVVVREPGVVKAQEG